MFLLYLTEFYEIIDVTSSLNYLLVHKTIDVRMRLIESTICSLPVLLISSSVADEITPVNYQSSYTVDTHYSLTVYEPNSSNDRFQFKISSNYADEYVHLESCTLSLIDREYAQEFIQNGCVLPEWGRIFNNKDRIISENADWFTMQPLYVGIKSKWHIECSVASCNRDFLHQYSDDKKFCKAGDECAKRYSFGVIDRERRSDRVKKTGSKIRHGKVRVELKLNH